MTKGNPDWEKFEKEVQELLDLRSTPGSGNQWHDVGDGVSRVEDPYKLVVDAKHTSRSSYSINSRALSRWWDVATGAGYHFALPVNLGGADAGGQRQWVVATLDDYAELVDSYRLLNSPKRCGAKAPVVTKPSCCRRGGHFGHHDNGIMEWSA